MLEKSTKQYLIITNYINFDKLLLVHNTACLFSASLHLAKFVFYYVISFHHIIVVLVILVMTVIFIKSASMLAFKNTKKNYQR